MITQKNDKSPKSKERTTYKTKSKNDDYYTPLNTSRWRILNEIMNAGLNDANLDIPKLLRTRNCIKDQSKLCLYLRASRHDTNDCFQ